MARTVKLFIDISQGILLAGINNPVPARTPRFVQGDNPTVEVHLVDTSAGTQLSPAPEVAFDDTAVIKIAIGKPGDVVAAFAELSTSLPGHLGRSGALNLNTTEIAALLGTAATVTTTLELQDTSGTSVDTPLQVPVIVSKELITDDSTPPTSFVSDIAALKAEAEGYAALAETAKVSAQTSAGQAAAAAGAADTSKTNAENSATAAEAARIQAEASAAAAGNADKLAKGDPRANAIGGVSLAGNGGDIPGYGTSLYTSLLNTSFELVFWCRRHSGSDERHRSLAAINTSAGEVALNFGFMGTGGGYYLGFDDSYQYQVANPDQWHVVSFGRDTAGWFHTCDGVFTSVADGFGVSGTPVSITRMLGGPVGGYGQMAGDVARVLWFQAALTVNQRAKLLDGDMDAAMLSVLHGRWEPLNVTGHCRWMDSSGDSDLVPSATGHGVTPLNPATGLVRVIKGTVAGASVSSGAVGSIGTLTATTAGLAAIRAGDALTASWGTVRPANAGGVSAYAPTDGAATLETAAHGAGVTISAGTAVNIIHHLN